MKNASNKPKYLDPSHWDYFLKLEADFADTLRYIECCEANEAAFSTEFAKQLVCICTECEALIKKICKATDPKNPATNMGHYKRSTLKAFPGIHKAPVYLGRRRRTLHPFADWHTTGGRLEWWNAYQDIKHHRDSNLEKANLGNTLNALSALLLLEIYLHAGIFANGTKELYGTRLLRAPGMPRTTIEPATDSLPNLPGHS